MAFIPEHGLTTNYPDQAAIHRQMMRQARYRVVVADHRKLDITGTTLIWPASEIDLLITDSGASKTALASLLKRRRCKVLQLIPLRTTVLTRCHLKHTCTLD